MSKENTSGKSMGARTGTDWERVRATTPEQTRAAIDASGERGTDEAFWRKAKVVLPKRPDRKKAITIRLDAEVLDWFRKEPGYQTKINAVLRSYMRVHEKEEA